MSAFSVRDLWCRLGRHARLPLLASSLSVHASRVLAQSTPGVAEASNDGFRMGLLWLCAALFAAGFLAMLLAIWRHRRAVKKRGESMQEPAWVELCWTLIPILIMAGAAWPVFKLLT